MAIVIDELKQPYSIDDTIQFLQKQTDDFGLFLDLDRLMEYELYFRMKAENERQEVLKGLGFPSYKLTDDNVKAGLIKKGIPDYKFKNKYDSVSFDKNVRANLISDESIDEELRMLVEHYDKYRAANYLVSYLPQYTSLPICSVPAYNGHRMVIAHPTWNRLRTFRISASNPSIVYSVTV